MAQKTERFEMRLDEDTIVRVDGWRGEQEDMPSRAEAIRRLVQRGLSKPETRSAVSFTDGEKLLFMVLRDMSKQLGIKSGDTDLDFVASAIYGGHSWAPMWDMGGLFHDHEDEAADVRLVVDVLDMWNFVEEGFTKLSKKEKGQLATEVGPWAKEVEFAGFDGNNEATLRNIARFFVDDMGRFSRFKGRDLNSHSPSLASHRRMLGVFKPIRASLVGVSLSLEQIAKILKASHWSSDSDHAE